MVVDGEPINLGYLMENQVMVVYGGTSSGRWPSHGRWQLTEDQVMAVYGGASSGCWPSYDSWQLTEDLVLVVDGEPIKLG